MVKGLVRFSHKNSLVRLQGYRALSLECKHDVSGLLLKRLINLKPEGGVDAHHIRFGLPGNQPVSPSPVTNCLLLWFNLVCLVYIL